MASNYSYFPTRDLDGIRSAKKRGAKSCPRGGSISWLFLSLSTSLVARSKPTACNRRRRCVARGRRTPNPGRERPRRERCIRVVRRATFEVGRGTRCPRSSIYPKLADFRAPSMTRRIGRAAAIHEGRTSAERKTETSARIETSRGNRSRVDSRGGYIGVGFHGSAREREREGGRGTGVGRRDGVSSWWTSLVEEAERATSALRGAEGDRQRVYRCF